MPFGLTVECYRNLGADLRKSVDDWLDENSLRDKKIDHFLQHEGFIEAVCYVQPLHLDETHRPAMEVRRFPTNRPSPVLNAHFTDAPG